MERRDFLYAGAGLLLPSRLLAAPLIDGSKDSPRFQFCLLRVGKHWNERARALIKLSFEIQKRCNIPIEGQYNESTLADAARVNSPFFIISGHGSYPEPSREEAGVLRVLLGGGALLLFDDTSPKGDDAFYTSSMAFMKRVLPQFARAEILPKDHAVYQSYYLLKEPRGRRNKEDYLEGWNLGKRTQVFYSHNDLLGAMEADPLGNWAHNMELGGGLRRELCFRLGINMTYYTLTINYKKDRAFPPIIERRRRL